MIDKHFAGVTALSGASLTVGNAEVHALIGQNGAGKSTLIKILTGYYARDTGSVVFDGQPLEIHSPNAAQAKGISTIYQEINLIPYRSVAENIQTSENLTVRSACPTKPWRSREIGPSTRHDIIPF